jgi:hypothetical protein
MQYLAHALSGLVTTPDPVHPRTWHGDLTGHTTYPCCTESRN